MIKWIFGKGSIFSQNTLQRSLRRCRIERTTGLWFLVGESFEKWIKEPRSFLWLHGKSLYTSILFPYLGRFSGFSDLSRSWMWQNDVMVRPAISKSMDYALYGD